jgi:hypothetical protein
MCSISGCSLSVLSSTFHSSIIYFLPCSGGEVTNKRVKRSAYGSFLLTCHPVNSSYSYCTVESHPWTVHVEVDNDKFKAPVLSTVSLGWRRVIVVPPFRGCNNFVRVPAIAHLRNVISPASCSTLDTSIRVGASTYDSAIVSH